jgi:hypothetical protein
VQLLAQRQMRRREAVRPRHGPLKDEDFACGVHIADEPLHGILCRRRQQRKVARHDAVAKLMSTRLHSLPGVTVVKEPPAPTAALPAARADLKVEVKARHRVPRHQVSGGQAIHARPSRSVCEGR